MRALRGLRLDGERVLEELMPDTASEEELRRVEVALGAKMDSANRRCIAIVQVCVCVCL